LRGLRSGVRQALARDIIAANRRALLEGEPWEIDAIHLDGEEISAWGWALPPAGEVPMIELNDRPFAVFENLPRGDVGARFWQRIGASESGFSGSSRLDEKTFVQGYARFSYANSPSNLPDGMRRDFYY